MGIVDVDMGIRALLVVLPLIGIFFFCNLFVLTERKSDTDESSYEPKGKDFKSATKCGYRSTLQHLTSSRQQMENYFSHIANIFVIPFKRRTRVGPPTVGQHVEVPLCTIISLSS